MNNPYIGGAEMKYYVVWSDHDELLCLTTDYGFAIDVHGEYMLNNGYLTDDSWADSNAHIQCFEEFPEDYDFIMGVLSDDEKLKWKHGETVMM